MDLVVGFVLMLLLALILVYLYLDRKFSYWSRRKVPHQPADSWIYGNAKNLFYDKDNSAVHYDKFYRKFEDQPYFGIYEFSTPVLILKDPQLVNIVLVEKYNSFSANKFTKSINKKANFLWAQNPFINDGEKWKETRSIVVSGITAHKIRYLEDIYKIIFPNLINYLNENDTDIEVFELVKMFNSELIAFFGWGISGSGFDPNSEVRKMFDTNPVLDVSAWSGLAFVLPVANNFLKIRFHSKAFEEFFKSITDQAIKSIEKNPSGPPTFLQHILKTREKLQQTGKDIPREEIYSHMHTFFTDGYETVSKVTAIVIQYLMMYPDVQNKLRHEIREAVNLEQITIDAVSKIEYLEIILNEIGRIFPIAGFISRVCVKKCKLGDFEVDEGTIVNVPLYSINRDPKYYPEPEVFNPENFTEESKNRRPKFSNLMFSTGPRICPGVKYATGNIKLFICYLVTNYEILPPKNHSVNPMKYDPQSVVFYTYSGDLFMRFKKI